MARALFVRLRDFVCFVWGRAKQTVSWLNIILSQHRILSKLSYAGQGAALMALLSAAFSDGRAISPVHASEPGAQMIAQASAAPFDFTTIFIGLAVALLVLTNLAMWRQRNDHAGTDEKTSSKDARQNTTLTKPVCAPSSDLVLARSIDLERQCQQLAQIADDSRRQNIDTELNSRVRDERLARICHDLRTPLNAVIGFSDLMSRETFGPLGHDKYLEYVQHIGDSGHNLLSAVDDIFEMSSEQEDASSVSNGDVSGPIAPRIDNQDVRAVEAAE